MINKVEKLWGSEEWIVNNVFYCGKILNLKRGFRTSFHWHKNKHETFYVLEGRVFIELDEQCPKGTSHIILPGDSLILRTETKHRFTPLEDSKIIEFSTHHEDSDTYRETQSEPISGEALAEILRIC